MPRYRDLRRIKTQKQSRLERWSIIAAVHFILGVFGVFRFLKWSLTALFLLIISLLKLVAVWLFRNLVVPVYRLIRSLRGVLSKYTTIHYQPLIHFVSWPWFLRVAALVFILGLVFWNRTDFSIRADAYGAGMPVALLVQSDEELLIEEGAFFEITGSVKPSQSRFSSGVIEAPLEMPEGYDDLAGEQTVTTTSDTTALLKPVITQSDLPPTRTGPIDYLVKEGDTVSSIAQDYGLSVNTILWANKLSAWSLIRPGRSLKIPPTSGIMHKIVKGDTLASLAAKYKVDPEQIRKFNDLEEGAKLALGREMVIPGARPLPPPAPRVSPIAKPFVLPSANVAPGSGMFWPIASRRITQYYNFRHHAIDIGVPTGTPVYASEDGVVERSDARGWNSGYGVVVIINHGGGVKTLYSHNSRLLVKVGEKVVKGQVIALSGNTGRSSGPHLHFEIIIGGVRKNPLSYVK